MSTKNGETNRKKKMNVDEEHRAVCLVVLDRLMEIDPNPAKLDVPSISMVSDETLHASIVNPQHAMHVHVCFAAARRGLVATGRPSDIALARAMIEACRRSRAAHGDNDFHCDGSQEIATTLEEKRKNDDKPNDRQEA